MVVVLLILDSYLSHVEKVISSPGKEKVKSAHKPSGPSDQASTYFQFL